MTLITIKLGLHVNTDKRKEKIAGMFDAIAPKYDLLNHTLSFGIDRLWRRRVVKSVKRCGAERILDIAPGTGDLSIALARGIEGSQVVGVDISEGMLKIGREKIEARGLSSRVELKLGDALELEFEDGSFDAVTVGFGVRNFEELEKGLAEMLRVLRPGGLMVILEFSMPKNPLFRALYKFYFLKVLPLIGNFTSKSSFAYTYLPESVSEFPSGEQFLAHLSNIGGVELASRELSLGIASIYTAHKR